MTLAVVFVLTIIAGIMKAVFGYSLLAAAQLQDYLYVVNFALSYTIATWALVLLFKKAQPQPAA